MTAATIDAQDARRLEAAFLAGLEEAQGAYERIVETEAWIALGYDTFAGWWDERIRPAMRALSMRPTREIAAAVVERVREEEADLPPAQRRREYELAEMVGATPDEIRDRSERSTSVGIPAKVDLPAPDPQPETDTTPTATCEACGGAIDPESARANYTRCESCDPEGEHHAFTAGAPCTACNPESEDEEDPDEDEPDPQPAPEPVVFSQEEIRLLGQVQDGHTVVASLRGQHANLIRWAEERGLYVRIDRRTEWGNPFELPADGDRDTVIRNYAEHYLPNKPSLLAKLGDLRGKVLGCWCAPEPCHGDVLKDRA